MAIPLVAGLVKTVAAPLVEKFGSELIGEIFPGENKQEDKKSEAKEKAKKSDQKFLPSAVPGQYY